jgi:hypothetical protein
VTELLPLAVPIWILPAFFLLAQAPSGLSGPGPEQKRLAYFEGTWRFRLQMHASPFGPDGLVTGTDWNELLPGGYFLVRRYQTQSPLGEFRGLEVLGWDATARTYFQRGFDNLGQTHLYAGAVEGSTWTWTFESNAGGKTYRLRITIQEASPTLQSYRAEISEDGKTRSTILEGTLTKEASP